MLTSQQCKMARAALDLGVRDLAEIADVSPNTVARLERGENMHRRTRKYLRAALEREGVAFLDRHAISAWGGEGVRLADDYRKSGMAAVMDAMWNLPDDEAALYRSVLEAFGLYLDEIEGEARQPDPWESDGMQQALLRMNRSQPAGARSFLHIAMTPPDNQSPNYPLSQERIDAAKDLDLAYFRRCVGQLRARGYGAATSKTATVIEK